MPSTFFGLNIGASGLAAYQASINTTANNVANVRTEGYSRQNTKLEATAAIRCNTRYGSTGTGVAATEVKQERDLYYDARYWENNASNGLFTQKLYYLDQIEEILKDDVTQQGFVTIFNKMFNGLDTLKTNAGDETVRNQFINQAQQLMTYFNSLSTSLSEIQDDCNEEIRSTVDNINSISVKIALLNKEVNQIELNGGYANELRDERARLLDELSNIVSVETTEYEIKNTNGEPLGGTHFAVSINGQVLVDGDEARQLECVVREVKRHQNDIKGMYNIRWADTKTEFAEVNGTSGGTLKGLFMVRDGNNNDALTGKVSAGSDANHIVMEYPSTTDVNALAIPDEGELRINGYSFEYSGWTASTDEKGNIVDVTFDLKEKNPVTKMSAVVDYDVVVGKNIDAMGIPYYQQQVTEFVRSFSRLFNELESQGQTLDGDKMGSFFVVRDLNENKNTFTLYEQRKAVEEKMKAGATYDTLTEAEKAIYDNRYKISSSDDSYYQLTAANAGVNYNSLRDPRYFAAALDITDGVDKNDLIVQLQKLQKDVTMFRGNNASAFLETLQSDISVDTNRTKIMQTNYSNLTNAINKRRQSISGVDEDEEAMNLVKFQNSYNLASKVISVMAQLYDKLINETGR